MKRFFFFFLKAKHLRSLLCWIYLEKPSQNAFWCLMKGRMCLLFLIAYLIKTPSVCAVQHEAHCVKAEGEMASSVSFWKLSSCQSRSDTFTMRTSSALRFRRVPLSLTAEHQNRPCDLQHADIADDPLILSFLQLLFPRRKWNLRVMFIY